MVDFFFLITSFFFDGVPEETSVGEVVGCTADELEALVVAVVAVVEVKSCELPVASSDEAVDGLAPLWRENGGTDSFLTDFRCPVGVLDADSEDDPTLGILFVNLSFLELVDFVLVGKTEEEEFTDASDVDLEEVDFFDVDLRAFSGEAGDEGIFTGSSLGGYSDGKTIR